jgi:mannose/fructose-specific phosphotransferase system component IIA
MAKRLICLAGHADIAAGVASAATLIMGDSDELRAAPSYTGDVDELRRFVDGLLDEIGDDGSLIIVTDLAGGSPSNTLLAYRDDPRVHQFAGMTLSLVIELLADDPLAGGGTFDSAFTERIRSTVTPLPRPIESPSDSGQSPTEEEDF